MCLEIRDDQTRAVSSGAGSAGTEGNYEVVASFLALLELYREDVVAFEQVAPLGDLYVSWTGGDREVLLAAPGALGGDPATATVESEEDYT